jgi:hypothetical protein
VFHNGTVIVVFGTILVLLSSQSYQLKIDDNRNHNCLLVLAFNNTYFHGNDVCVDIELHAHNMTYCMHIRCNCDQIWCTQPMLRACRLLMLCMLLNLLTAQYMYFIYVASYISCNLQVRS